MEEKTVVILGATGSIGTQAVDVIGKIPGFKIVGISFGKNGTVAQGILNKFQVRYYLGDVELDNGMRVESTKELLERTQPDIVVSAIPGFDGVMATLDAMHYTKRLALATKEAMVCTGPFVKHLARENDVEIVPVDSEHSAIFQMYESNVDHIVITASGGAVRDVPLDKMDNLMPEEILKHPTWNMGKRITIDSATMVNKFFEVVEAHELFDLPYEEISVRINPSSFVHGIVFLKDGTIKIHAGKPDMRVPIAYALTYPSRQYESYVSSVEEFDTRLLPIEKDRYPLFFYGLEVVRSHDKGELVRRIAFNSADEVAVEYFLERKISFGGIYQTIRTVVEKIDSEFSTVSSIEDVFNIDMLSRRYATEFLEKLTDNYR